MATSTVVWKQNAEMADDEGFQDVAESKNPLYAFAQAQAEDIMTLDQSPGVSRRFRPTDTATGEATTSKSANLKKHGGPESGSSSGSLSPVGTMSSSNAMRARLDSGRGEHDDEIKCPRVNCKEKIVRRF